MKFFSEDAQEALENGNALVSAAVEIFADPVFRVFGGFGVVTIDGHDFTGIGDRQLIQSSGAAVGGTAQAITLTLSEVEPEVADLLDADALRGAAVVIRRLIFDGTGTELFDVEVFARGKIDQLSTDETVGGLASIVAVVETAARGLGRTGGRMRTDADQRLIKANDGGFREVSYAGEKTLYWGGHRPASAGSAISHLPPAYSKIFSK